MVSYTVCSRVADEEEFDEADENGLDYFMQRHAAAFNALNSSSAVNGSGAGNAAASSASGQSSAASAVMAMRERVSELSHNLNMLAASENIGMNTQAQMQMHMSDLEAAAAAMGNSMGLNSGSAMPSGLLTSNGVGVVINVGNSVGSPTRDEVFGVRRGIVMAGSSGGGIARSCKK